MCLLALCLLGLKFASCASAGACRGCGGHEPKAPVPAAAARLTPHARTRYPCMPLLRLRGGVGGQHKMSRKDAAANSRSASTRASRTPAPPPPAPAEVPRVSPSPPGGAVLLEGVPSVDGHHALITCLEYKRGFVYTGSVDRTVRVWDAVSGECLQVSSRVRTSM